MNAPNGNAVARLVEREIAPLRQRVLELEAEVAELRAERERPSLVGWLRNWTAVRA